jgi:hypothetical protein
MTTPANHDHRPVQPIDLEAGLAAALVRELATGPIEDPVAIAGELCRRRRVDAECGERTNLPAETRLAGRIAVDGALQIAGHTVGRVALEPIPAARIVLLVADNRHVTLADPGPADRLGVAVDDDVDVGNIVTVALSGTEEVTAAEHIKRGAPLAPGPLGRAVMARGLPGDTIGIIGYALAEAAPGEAVPVLLTPGVLYP